MEISDARLFKLSSLLFDAALGKSYYDELSGAVAEFGIAALADSWGTSSLVLSELGEGTSVQAATLVKHFGLDPTNTDPESGDAFAFNYFKSNLDAGVNPGVLALAAIEYLEQYDLPVNLHEANLFLNNRAEVAFQYSKQLELGARDIAELKAVIANVNEETQSVVTAVELMSHKKFDEVRLLSPLNTYTDADETIEGTNENDHIDGGAGNDQIEGGGGHDILLGGSGDDTLKGGEGLDRLEGGDGNDILEAGGQWDGEYSEKTDSDGNPFIYAGFPDPDAVDAFHEILDGGNGNDTISGNFGSDYITGGEGDDIINGEKYSYLSTVYPHMFNDFIDGGAGDDTINGNAGNDTIIGGEGADTISGDEGNDIIHGGEGADKLNGGWGQDIVHGGAGDDYIGVKTLYPIDALGYDLIVDSSDRSIDTYYGDEGDDTIHTSGGDIVDGGVGSDAIYLSRLNGAPQSIITAGEGTDYIRISNAFGDMSTSVIIDFNEVKQVKDEVEIELLVSAINGDEIRGFDLATDLINLSSYQHIFGDTRSYASVGRMQETNNNGGFSKNFVQIVSSTETPWIEYSVTGGQESGKAYFVIQGAAAASASKADVAAFLDDYGNDARYQASASHVFLVNIQDVGIGIYNFVDDGTTLLIGNKEVVANEIIPVAVLTGLTTEEINMSNADFMV